MRAIREAGDAGSPSSAADPAHPQSRAFREIAERILVRLDEARRTAAPRSLPVVELTGDDGRGSPTERLGDR